MYSKKDFAQKMDWEGGIYSLAQYGLDPEDIKDKKLKSLWGEFMKRFQACEEIADQIEAIIPDAE